MDALKHIMGELEAYISPASRRVNYMGFGLKLGEARDLALKLRDEPYAYDKDGKQEFELDIKDLASKLDRLYLEYLGLKEHFSGDR